MNGKTKSHCYHAIRAALCAVLGAPIFGHNADATSFLCTDVKAVSEKPICGDAGLLRLDKKLSAAHQAVLQSLSETGRAEFRTEQREWLKYTQMVWLAD
jgi:uncharacterized protein